MSLKHLFTFIAIVSLLNPLFSATIDVPADYPTIQAGITAAVDGDTVLIASGTFTGDGNTDISFLGKAIVVKSTEGPDSCIIDGGWAGRRGFVFNSNEGSGSILEGIQIYNCFFYGQGAGIYLAPSLDPDGPVIKNCIINNNYAEQYGGGIYCDSSRVNLIDCQIIANSARSGGGMYCRNSNVVMEDAYIYYNSTTDAGGGLWMDHCNAVITNNTFYWNFACGNGGAVHACNSTVSVRGCTFSYGYAVYNGGGAYLNNSVFDVQNCTFWDCNSGWAPNWDGGAVYIDNEGADTTFIVNSIFDDCSYDNNCISVNRSPISILYCDFYNNESNFYGELPAEIGIVDTVNANGDSCDIYGNIYLDPQFVEPDSFDFHLLSTSPCIDAGNPASAYDPDSTIADIGAFYFYHVSEVENIRSHNAIEFAMLDAYPNPFNNSLAIVFSLPSAGVISLAIFDIQGRKIAEIQDGFYEAGLNRINFTPENLSSGVYFCRLHSGQLSAVNKIALIK